MADFDIQVKSLIPADQFKLLNAAAAKKRTTVGAIVAEIVAKAVRPKVPGPAKPRGAIGYATTETIATFDRMYAEKRIDADIALATGMSHSWVARRRKSLGLPRVGALGPMTRLERERLTPLAPTTNTETRTARARQPSRSKASPRRTPKPAKSPDTASPPSPSPSPRRRRTSRASGRTTATPSGTRPNSGTTTGMRSPSRSARASWWSCPASSK